nr:peptidase C25 [Flavobacterium sp.]
MKKITTVLILLTAYLGISQEQGSITLNWTEKKQFSFGEYDYFIPQFNPENYQFDSYTKTLKFNLRLKLDNAVAENSLQLSNIIFEPISENQLGDLSQKNIPSTFKYSFKNSTARDISYGQISVTPIIKEGNTFKKLISFSYTIASSNRTRPTSNNVNSVDNSVLASGNWYRFYVQKSGIYKVSKNFLQSLGMETNVDPRKIKIYGNGGRMAPLLN